MTGGRNANTIRYLYFPRLFRVCGELVDCLYCVVFFTRKLYASRTREILFSAWCESAVEILRSRKYFSERLGMYEREHASEQGCNDLLRLVS